MNRMKALWKRIQLPLAFTAMVFCIMLLAIFIVFLCIGLLAQFGALHNMEQNRLPLFFFGIVSLLVGTVLAALLSRLPLKPLRELMNAADKIADGDYSVRLALNGPEDFRNLGRKFNHMAEELGSVEMLRDDFVNNFSHEFKTPIVSIRGFARMLKLDDLTAEERDEYLDIIIQESERLSELSTNVLNLSKVEQQTILTDKKRFNVTEQIRLVIAVLASKWSEKGVEFQLDCDEVYVYGNEELLRQVWINLLDNAIKFSPDGGGVEISICPGADFDRVSIANRGKSIPPESIPHIFDKFYQGDSSRATKGNGLGLTLVQRIVQLHNGAVHLKESNRDRTVFEVLLPSVNPEDP